MTNIEALKMLKAQRECRLKWIDPSGGCSDDKCNSCDLNYEQGCMGEQAEALHIAIESLEAWGKLQKEIDESITACKDDARNNDWYDGELAGFLQSRDMIGRYLSEVSE
jgi:hypothetical protein